MNFFKNLFSSRGKATAIYKRAMDKANQRDYEGAIEEYTLIVDMAHAPEDMKAMARFNRALALSSSRNFTKAELDLQTVLAAPDTPANIKTAARDKLKRMKTVQERLNASENSDG